MMNIFRYGFNKTFAKIAVWLSWPIIIAGKRLSSYPVLKWIINPFFAYPYNEVTAIPIHTEVPQPDNVVLPRRVAEKIIERSSHIFIFDECVCRSRMNCRNYPIDIGCMALGRAAKRIHPSHGHTATVEEAIEHVARAASAGLIANVAHTWIDSVAFGLPNFNKLMFICFCDDCCCIFRTHMKKRGPNLDKAYKKLPGISIEIDREKCSGCGICKDQCFVAAIEMIGEKASIGQSCKGCGRCVECCPEGALSLKMDNLDELVDQVTTRISGVADITSP